MNEQQIRLRPHHLLCIRFFSGHGYSEDFTKHMKAVVARLKSGERFTTVFGLDTLCSKCPNNLGGECESEEKVQRYDGEVKRLCSLEENAAADWSGISRTVSEKIFSKGLFSSVCADCSWAALCHGSKSAKES